MGCTQGTPSLLGSVASGTPGREGQTPCPGRPVAVGEAGLCLLLLWPEAVCKLSSRQPMRNSNNQRLPQPELQWSERPSCQMWRQRTDPGPLRVFSHFHRSGVWGPMLGAVGTSSHDNPRFCYCFQCRRWSPSGPISRKRRAAESAQPGPRILGGGETEMVTRGSRHESREQGLSVFVRPFPCSPIQSPVQRAPRVRSRGDQAMVDTVRASCHLWPHS